MCVFASFCSVVVVLFVVRTQQHCRYIVIDAMVYPKNWILEDEFGTGKTPGVFRLNIVFLHLDLRLKKIFEFGSYDSVHEVDRDEFWMMLHHQFCGFGRRTVFGYIFFCHLISFVCLRLFLIMNVIWNHEHFSTERIHTW